MLGCQISPASLVRSKIWHGLIPIVSIGLFYRNDQEYRPFLGLTQASLMSFNF
jgi:hypothetical protein